MIDELDEIIEELEQMVDTLPDDNIPGYVPEDSDGSGYVSGKRLAAVHTYDSSEEYSHWEYFTYNENGLLISYVSDENDCGEKHTYEITYAYNENGQMVRRLLADAYCEYTYYSDGTLYSLSDQENGTGHIVYEYDVLHRLARTYLVMDNYSGQQEYDYSEYSEQWEYTYNEAGLVSTVIYTQDYGEDYGDMLRIEKNTYTYDDAGYICSFDTVKDVWGVSYSLAQTCNYDYYPFILQVHSDEDSTWCSLELYLSTTGIPCYDFYTWLDIDGIHWGSWEIDNSFDATMEDGYLTKVISDDYVYEFFYEDIFGADTTPSGGDNVVVDATPEPAMDVYTLLKTYFYANYSDSDMVYLADVTQDGQDEMLVVHLGDSEGNTIYGHVYAVVDGTVQEIYSNSGSSSHAGGFYSWYLTKAAGVGYNLCEESFDMWQGYGTLAYWEYTVNPDGTTWIVYDISVTGDDAPVDDDSYNAYVSTLGERLSNCYAIYYTSSEGGGAPLLDTSPASVFYH